MDEDPTAEIKGASIINSAANTKVIREGKNEGEQKEKWSRRGDQNTHIKTNTLCY